MGIDNIHILISISHETDLSEQLALDMVNQARATKEAALMLDHRKGKHPYGSMLSDCPLCRLGR